MNVKQKQILSNQLAILSALASIVESQAEKKALLKEYLITEKIIIKKR